jgi:hypothetical protein
MGKADDRAWLIECGFSTTRADELLANDADAAAAAKAREGFLRQSDYDRKMNSLKAEFDTKQQQLDRDLAAWADMQAQDGEKSTAQLKKIQDLEASIFKQRQAIDAFATANNLDVKQILGDQPAAQPAPLAQPATPALDPKDYLKASDVASMFDYTLNAAMVIPALQAEHQRLFGQPLDTRELQQEIFARVKTKQPIDLQAVWEAKYNVPTKRTEVAEAQRQAEINAAEERGYGKRVSEESLPGARPVGHVSPVLVRQGGAPIESKLQRPQPGSRITGAAEALASHRYRPAVQGAK